ncbi:MAG: hypothetical protein EF811_03870 [Methanonatronarchaeia archaeon]|nr:MAG: hypothetical protein EF811_03870 [Methanonatronarchaeia archaeon]
MTEEDSEKFVTTFQLKKKWFEKVVNREKVCEIRKNRRSLEPDDVIRFTNGYDPSNGWVPAKVTGVFVYDDLSKVRVKEVTEIRARAKKILEKREVGGSDD